MTDLHRRILLPKTPGEAETTRGSASIDLLHIDDVTGIIIRIFSSPVPLFVSALSRR